MKAEHDDATFRAERPAAETACWGVGSEWMRSG